ncbi:hypothetical protein NDU88_007851 [Pleurodeles waltl]|uniref:Uncharacterized protein n=1 Tax=Pleurodeles waltl TaxID=8319 RepID=A0AAV7QQ92_PLEWA|nr:hypothetical protein NDU88_007851 [Pleurodeles waltl]
MPHCPARARRRVRGPAPARTGAAPASSSSAALPLHGAGPSRAPGPPPQHLRRSGETRLRSPAALGPSALVPRRPSAQLKPVASATETGHWSPLRSAGPGPLSNTLWSRNGGPATPRASLQFSASARAQIRPEMACFASTFSRPLRSEGFSRAPSPDPWPRPTGWLIR